MLRSNDSTFPNKPGRALEPANELEDDHFRTTHLNQTKMMKFISKTIIQQKKTKPKQNKIKQLDTIQFK